MVFQLMFYSNKIQVTVQCTNRSMKKYDYSITLTRL